MRYLALAVAGTLVAAAALAGSATAATLGEAPHGKPQVSHLPPGSLGEARMRHRQAAPQVSPHIGLPGISGFPQPSDNAFRRGFHHGGHRGDFGYWGYAGDYDEDGYVDTIPTPDQFGYFSTGGRVTMEGEAPVYHYDRSYPYDWYGGAPRATGASATTGLHCRVHTVWDDEQRKEVPVRVCGPY